MWDAGVDYLRLTHRRQGSDGYPYTQYVSAGERVASICYPYGQSVEPWKWYGYYGGRVGSIAWGVGNAGCVVQASGVAARELFDAHLPHTNVPRLDIQATFWYEQDRPEEARKVGALAVDFRRKRRGRPFKVRVIDGTGEGDTTYIGARGKKSKFLRVYDKWRESDKQEDYRYAWRYEAELSDVHAVQAHGSLLDLPKTHYSSYAVCSGFFSERGVHLPEVEGATILAPDKLPRDETTTERTLRWLRDQIRPAIEKAISRGATPDAIVGALGLSSGMVLESYLHQPMVRAKIDAGR